MLAPLSVTDILIGTGEVGSSVAEALPSMQEALAHSPALLSDNDLSDAVCGCHSQKGKWKL